MNPATLSALAALAGSAIGALATLATTWLTQRYQDRMQRALAERTRREKLFGAFIIEASKCYGDALVHTLTDPSVLVPLYSLKAQLGLFATKRTVDCADKVLMIIVDTYYHPTHEFQNPDAIKHGVHDILSEFTQACRAELLVF